MSLSKFFIFITKVKLFVSLISELASRLVEDSERSNLDRNEPPQDSDR